MIELYGYGARSSYEGEWATAIFSAFTDRTLSKLLGVSAITDVMGRSVDPRMGIQAGTHEFGPENGTL